MKEQIKEILKSEGLSWEKFSNLNEGIDRRSFQRKIKDWSEKLNDTFDKIGYEVIIIKKKDTIK